MESQVKDRELVEAIEATNTGLDAVFGAGLGPVDSRDAIEVIKEIEALGHRIDAAKAQVLAAIDSDGLYREDRHASAKVMVRHVAKLPAPDAARRAGAVRALRDLPLVAEKWRAGELGTAQVARIVRVYANPRVREALIKAEAGFVKRALRRDYKRFDLWVTRWVDRMDADGTADQSQRNHETRDGKIAQEYSRGWSITAQGGELAGLQIQDIWKHFLDAEFKTDWAKCVDEYGDEASLDKLVRTDAQRRFDALLAIFVRAASTPPGGVKPIIVTNVVIDWITYMVTLARLQGAKVPEPDPNKDSTSRCSSIDGHPLDPTEVVASSLTGYVRRVILDSASVVIDMGRKQRLFRGSAALAARLSSIYCYWPGCYVPASQSQIDHIVPYEPRDDGSGGGCTDTNNSGPACGRHNRDKEDGYTVWRDEAGEWHVYRPDGTEIE